VKNVLSIGQGPVRRATREKLRQMYKDTWGREWPHDDDYLDTLWREVREKTPTSALGNYGVPAQEMLELGVLRMRENHVFDEVAPAQENHAAPAEEDHEKETCQ
jgi:hypothetical protein